MGDRRRARCQRCNGHRDDVGEISWSGLCIGCAQEGLTMNVAQMYARTGPNWKKWRRAMAGCVGGVLLEDMPKSG
jgi:hypothetical protein